MSEEKRPQVWYHFIGGYYSAPSFIAEARAQDVSRRVALGVARKMAWGDFVIILKCLDRSIPRALVLGAFEIRRITLSEAVAAEVGAQLLADGRASFLGGDGQIVKRACGSYVPCGTWTVDADLSEVLEIAAKVSKSKGEKAWCLVGGPLIRVYHPPCIWERSINFHRTFTLAEPDQVFVSGYDKSGRAWIEDVKLEGEPQSEILAVKGYQKRTRAARQDVYSQPGLF